MKSPLLRRTVCAAALLVAVAAPSASAQVPIPTNLPVPNGVSADGGAPEVGTIPTSPAPSTPGSSKPGNATTNATPFPYRFQCNWPWATINSQPASWAIGNCANTELIDATTYLVNQNITWIGGYLGGNYNGCGFISASFSAYVGSNPNPNACAFGTASRAEDEFIFRDGAGNQYIWGSATDGQRHNNASACAFYANFRPWSSSANPNTAIRTIPANAINPADGLSRIAIRYMTKNAAANGSGYYVMARDRAAEAGWGNWGFIPASCL